MLQLLLQETLLQLVAFSGESKTNSFFESTARLRGHFSNAFCFMWFLCLWTIADCITKTNSVKPIDDGKKQLYILKHKFSFALLSRIQLLEPHVRM